jgi:hypothetical protein
MPCLPRRLPKEVGAQLAKRAVPVPLPVPLPDTTPRPARPSARRCRRPAWRAAPGRFVTPRVYPHDRRTHAHLVARSGARRAGHSRVHRRRGRAPARQRRDHLRPRRGGGSHGERHRRLLDGVGAVRRRRRDGPDPLGVRAFATTGLWKAAAGKDASDPSAKKARDDARALAASAAHDWLAIPGPDREAAYGLCAAATSAEACRR